MKFGKSIVFILHLHSLTFSTVLDAAAVVLLQMKIESLNHNIFGVTWQTGRFFY